MTCDQEDEDAEGNAEEKADMRLYRYTEGEDQDGVKDLLRLEEERERLREREIERGHMEHRCNGEDELHERDKREPKQKAAEDGDGDEDEGELSVVRRRSF